MIPLTPRRYVTSETLVLLYPSVNLSTLPSRIEAGVTLYDSMAAYEQHQGKSPLVELMLNNYIPLPKAKPPRKQRGEPSRNRIEKREIDGVWYATALWLQQEYGVSPHRLQELASEGRITRLHIGTLNWYTLEVFEHYWATRRKGRTLGAKDKQKRKAAQKK